jgi:hypothetical protein
MARNVKLENGDFVGQQFAAEARGGTPNWKMAILLTNGSARERES